MPIWVVGLGVCLGGAMASRSAASLAVAFFGGRRASEVAKLFADDARDDPDAWVVEL